MLTLHVVIPYYGDPGYLLRAVESVRGLVETQWRITILEDCYPDGPRVEHQIEDLSDDRINYLRNDRNLGVAGNQHRAMEAADSEYFVKLDADDMLMPNYGVHIAGLMERFPAAAVFQPGVEVIDEDGIPYRPLPDRLKGMLRPWGGPQELSGEALAVSLMRGNWLYTPALCYRRDFSRDLTHRQGSDAVNDLSMIVDILLRGGSLALGVDPAFWYRRHRQSHSSELAKTGQRFSEERAFFEAVQEDFAAKGWRRAAAAARHHPFSRLNALTQVPGAVAARRGRTAGALLAHALR